MAIRRAAVRFRAMGSLPGLFLTLLLLSGAAFSQDRTEAHERDSGPGERQAVPSEPSPPPAAEPAVPSEPSPPPSAEPAAPAEPDTPGSPSEPAAGASDPSTPRTAVPTRPGGPSGRPERQPPTQHDHGSGGHGRGGGVVYDPYDPYDPTNPYGVYGGPAQGGYGGGSGGHRRAKDELGALDLDLSPGRTQVYLNGEYIGTADDYDGWPRYLWLPPDTYDLVFYLEGYKTLSRQIRVRQGLVIDMDDRLEKGASTRPEDL